jgi:chemotaxis protein methyltransferase CheR
MTDAEFVAFLQWSTPRLGLRWRGFRNVRGTVRKRLRKRMAELGIQDLNAYRVRLESHPEEWSVLNAMCRIPISRFYRDRAVFDMLRDEIVPERARAARETGQRVRIWSAGCASGEEPYTVAILWHLHIASSCPDIALEILATDADETMLARARRGCYAGGSLPELPSHWRVEAFRQEGPLWCVRDEFRQEIAFRCEDLRTTAPDGPFDVVLCRNVAFTYFDEALQYVVAERLLGRLRPGGVLVLGNHEALPHAVDAVRRRGPCVYERSRTSVPPSPASPNDDPKG